MQVLIQIVGAGVGTRVGLAEREWFGTFLGEAEGTWVGRLVGVADGTGVEAAVAPHSFDPNLISPLLFSHASL